MDKTAQGLWGGLAAATGCCIIECLKVLGLKCWGTDVKGQVPVLCAVQMNAKLA
jgi:hypothetical protein